MGPWRAGKAQPDNPIAHFGYAPVKQEQGLIEIRGDRA